MKAILDRVEHLIFRFLKEEQSIYCRTALVYPEKKLICFNRPSQHIVDTGRARWTIHGFSSWNTVPAGLLEKNHFDPENPEYNVILTPQKFRQVPAIIPPQRVLTSDSKETDFWLFTGCLREKYYY